MDNLDSNIPEVSFRDIFLQWKNPERLWSMHPWLNRQTVLSTQAASLFWCFVGFDLTKSTANVNVSTSARFLVRFRNCTMVRVST